MELAAPALALGHGLGRVLEPGRSSGQQPGHGPGRLQVQRFPQGWIAADGCSADRDPDRHPPGLRLLVKLQ